MPARLFPLVCLLSTPVAAPNWNQPLSLLKGAAHCCGIPAVAKTARLVWVGQWPKAKPRPRSAASVRAAASELAGQSPPAPLQDKSDEEGLAEADFGGSLLLLWLAGLICGVVFLVARLGFDVSGRFFNWLLRGWLTCRGTSIRLRPLRFVLVFHDVKLESHILSVVEASGLGGYLPCKLESMEIDQLELALQLMPVLRFLWHLVLQLTRRRSFAWKQESLDSLEAMQSGRAAAWGAACPMRVLMRGARLRHVAISELGEWWGGPAKLDESYALFYKAFYLEQLSGLLAAHQPELKGDGAVRVDPTEYDHAFRVLLRGMFIVCEELQVLYVDPALPGELRLELGRLEVQMSESVETTKSGLPLLGKVPSQIAARLRKADDPQAESGLRLYLGPAQKAEMYLGHGASSAKPLLSACAGTSGGAGADGGGGGGGGGSTEEPAAAHTAREAPEAPTSLRQRVRGWMRGIAAAAIHLGRDGGEQQGWFEVEIKQTPRLDLINPLQLKVSCPDFRVQMQPMHVTLLSRLQSIYFTYSGVAWERVQQVNESAGFPHDLPAEEQGPKVLSAHLGMPKVLMLLAEQHCELAMRTDGALRDDDPTTHPLGELCKASAQLRHIPLHILLYARFLAKCQRPQAPAAQKRPRKFIRALHLFSRSTTIEEESSESHAAPQEVSLARVFNAHVAAAAAAQRNDSNDRPTFGARSDSAASGLSTASDTSKAAFDIWRRRLLSTMLNRRGRDLLKHAEGWMLDPPELKPWLSEAPLPGCPLPGCPLPEAEAHGMRVQFEFQKAVVVLATDGVGKEAYAGSTVIAEVRLEPRLAEPRLEPRPAAQDSEEQEAPCPGLRLILRKTRLASLYHVSVGRLCITDERPKAKEKCPSPEGTVVRLDGRVLGKRISDGSVVTGDLSGGAPAARRVIATNTTLKPTTAAGPDGEMLECSTVVGSDGQSLGQLQPDGDRPKHPFREFLAPVVRTRRESPASPSRRRSSGSTSSFSSGGALLSKLALPRHDGVGLHAAPLLEVKFEKVKSAAPAFLLPEKPGQLPASESSCLEVHVSHAAVVLLLDFVTDVSAWCKTSPPARVRLAEDVSARNEARRRSDRYAQLYPAPTPATTEPGSRLALGGAPVQYLVTLEDVYIALPDHNPSQKCIERKRGWAFCVGLGGDVSIEGDQRPKEDGALETLQPHVVQAAAARIQAAAVCV